MLLDVTAGKLLCADNNPHWVAIGINRNIFVYKSDNFSFVYNCVSLCVRCSNSGFIRFNE
jgi:hypothetical protein